MAKFTIFTNKSFNAFLNGVGPAWEEYIAQGHDLPMTLKLVPADWKPSEGSMIITDFDSKNEAEDRTAFHRHFPASYPTSTSPTTTIPSVQPTTPTKWVVGILL